MSEKLKIAVSGYAATYPYGGVFWDYIQYALGFRQLGHDVLYVEDTGRWCYDPVAQTFVGDGTANATILDAAIQHEAPELAKSWSVRDGVGEYFGMPAAEVRQFCRDADLFVHLSASCMMREEHFAADRVIFIDSDPMYTPATIPGGLDEGSDHLAWLRRHDAFFTFGECVGQPDCRIDTRHLDWQPTRQPIVCEVFDEHIIPVEQRRRVATTLASWEPTESATEVDGESYSGKGSEFLRFVDLPSKAAIDLELALSGAAPRDRLQAAGWRLREGWEVSSSPRVYRNYLADSTLEWSVAKNAYVKGRSGWFSCRSACYLALGVPCVLQDTGFSRHMPVGRGVIAFEDQRAALAGIDSILADPHGHAKAARDFARSEFDARHVLSDLIERSFASKPSVAAPNSERADHPNCSEEAC